METSFGLELDSENIARHIELAERHSLDELWNYLDGQEVAISDIRRCMMKRYASLVGRSLKSLS